MFNVATDRRSDNYDSRPIDSSKKTARKMNGKPNQTKTDIEKRTTVSTNRYIF